MPDPEVAQKFDYIIVGSGAGGAPLAARLAIAGKKVLVLEAGPNQAALTIHDPAHEVTRVPVLHGASSEHEALAWRFFVDHYQRNASGRLPDELPEDPKWHEPDSSKGEGDQQRGIFYPRATGVGGCTIHNAMITIAGPDSDWDNLADFLGDPSWCGVRMRPYFQKVEHNDSLPTPDAHRRSGFGQHWKYCWDSFRWLSGFSPDATGGRHGFRGWLHTSVADLSLGLGDSQLRKMLTAALLQAKKEGLDRAWTLAGTFLKGRIRQSLDPNHYETQQKSPEGIVMIPVAVYGGNTNITQNSQTPYAQLGRRSSPRELLHATQVTHPDHLTIRTNCFVTKILLTSDETPRAIGVEYLEGERLYRASVRPTASTGVLKQVYVNEGGEVILCGGAFNTPQLLMLSGIGPRADNGMIGDEAGVPLPTGTTPVNVEIPCRVPLPGVGLNLQDRYEVSVVSQMKEQFNLLKGADLRLPDDPEIPDRHLRQWRDEGTGLYASNGGVLGIFKRSKPDLPQPDLFIFGVPLAFEGYKVGYSRQDKKDRFSWIILKSHSGNNDGTVRLRSADPLDTPLINFHSFRTRSAPHESAKDPDVMALAEGVKFARGILKHATGIVASETHPGKDLVPDNDTDAMHNWIRRDAWGHHACGTCRMGPDGDPKAVLNSRFQVRGVKGLRVVDASIFPNIPGYFIVTNIYMASEKAADVILQDAERSDVVEQSVVYPAGLRKLESEAIATRRRRLTCNTGAANDSEIAAVGGANGKSRQWANDVTGLALSGGGIRSATLCLGVLQSFAKAQWLRKIDILSTVSGGGYIGGFLGRQFDRFRRLDCDNKESQSVADPALAVEQVLNSPDSRAVDWLRRHGNYLSPQGGGDGRTNFAVFVRNLLSVHLVVGLALFTLFGLSNGFRYTLLDKLSTSLGLVFDSGSMPIGHLVSSWSGAFFSPWFFLAELLILFLVVPRIIAYWIVSQDQHESFKPVSLSILIAVSGVFLLFGVKDGAKPELIFSGLSLLTSIVHVEFAWRRGTQVEAAMGTGSVETRRLRTRNYLTYDLGLALALTGGALVFVLIDTVGHGLVEWQVLKNGAYARAFAALIAAIMTAMPVGRWLTSFLTEESAGRPSTIVRILKSAMVPAAMAVVLFTLPLVFYSFASHASFAGGQTPWLGWMLTLGAAALTCAFALPSAVSFVNRSSLAATYSARLARAYLGASNPLRHRPGGADVTEVMDGDDVPSIRDYKPHEASGPLHLINLTLNQTVDVASQLSKRDRQGENLAVSCIGMTVGEKWHSVWANSGSVVDSAGTKIPTRLDPAGWVTGTKHPLVDQLDRPADQAEMLSLRQWIGLSGAAIDGGRGRGTQLGLSLLMGLVNIRTGYWWDSGIAHADRCGFPELSFTRRLLYLVPRFFATQCLLLYEWVARYPGPWERFWHFSDGGFFENLGCYELIRRRIPRIIVCDCGADPEFEFEDLGELVRKARIDFGATIHEFTPSDIAAYVPQQIHNRVGNLAELVPVASTGSGPPKSPKHVTLFWIRFADTPEQRCVMLYLKATVGVDSPVDIQNYHTKHPEFPHEATADQFFDETQWESYRRLGELLSADLVNARDNNGNPAPNWFWQIPVA